jgi:acetyl esterase/lipase
MSRGPRVPTAVARRVTALACERFVREDIAWETQRSRYAMTYAQQRAPRGVEASTRVVGGVPCLEMTPKDARDDAAIVHIHDGGYCIGSPRNARAYAGWLARHLSVRVVMPDYRLAPEHPFPAAFEDAAAVTDAVFAEFGRVALSGASAGGGLATAVAADRRDAGRASPDALVLLSPWLDLTDNHVWDLELASRDPILTPEWIAACGAAYATGDFYDPRVSPLLGSVAGLPAALVICGSDEILASDSMRFAAAVHAAGGSASLRVVPGLWHIFALQVGTLREADRATQAVADFLGGALS